MLRSCCAAMLVVAVGCSTTVQDKVRDYNADGLQLFQAGQYDKARETFAAAIELAPEDTTLRFNHAQCYERLGDVKKAETMYTECVQRSPNHAESRQALCTLMVRQNRRDEAVKMVEEWLTKEPRLADPYVLDGWLWNQAGNLPRAHARLQQAVQLDPSNPRALNELAQTYESMSYPDRALVLYERSLAVQPQQPAVTDRVNRLRAQGVKPPRPE